jgi:DNA-binding CsgD family transcriptional regulator
MIAEGMTSREIGASLHIHIKTVESHRMHLMRRLGIHDVAGLVRYAIRHKVVLTE